MVSPSPVIRGITMKIGVIGTGYVGLVQGVVLSDFGHHVICMDVDNDKIEKLKNGEVPIYEPGLGEILRKNLKSGRLSFTTNMIETVEYSEVIFIAVGTPPQDDGSADLKYVRSVAKDIGNHINGYKVVVNKSTVPVGTGKIVTKVISDIIKERNLNFEFDVVSNPEFLREGAAVRDTMRPDRVVIGTTSQRAMDVMKEVYDVLYINNTSFVFSNIETAEMIKYASNAFLAVKISFINEMALLAEKVGGNVQVIAKAMGMDGRISSKFLHAGPGYGGSCFPKDTKAIYDIGLKHGEEMMVIKAAIDANEKQKHRMVSKIINTIGSVKGLKIAILGLSFKPETDDVREAPAIDIISELIQNGAKIQTYCPQGMVEAKWRLAEFEKDVTYCKDAYEASLDADALVLITEWNQFRGMDLKQIRKNMNGAAFFDLRNVFTTHGHAKELFDYYPVGI
jgi:UDPglucose 6-dehydrogenase